MKIDLPKFSGYKGKIDYFTFKSKFKKFEPCVQKQFWAEYLKLNYLEGLALTLVEKETEYSKIWDRLRESFGSSRLLLQNKMSDLEKIGGLWKVKGDAKVAETLASLINVMKDLSSLALEHDIEGQLYEGGGLEKVLSLLSDRLHRKFRSQSLSATTEREGPSQDWRATTKQKDWELLIIFLQSELELHERLALDHKTSRVMGLSSKFDEKKSRGNMDRHDDKRKEEYAHTTGGNELLCHICDKPGHTLVTTARKKTIIPYYVCEEFVKMTPTQRLIKLKSKRLCTGCIYPGAKNESTHKCFFSRYCCSHPSHSDKIHVLLCEQHKNDGKNVELLV